MLQHIIEAIAVISAFLSVYYSVNRSLLLWLTGVISQITYFWLFLRLALYGDALLQIIFLVITIYGWVIWYRQQGQVNERQVSYLTFKQQFSILIATMIGIYFLSLGLRDYTNDALPFFDACITLCSITGQCLLCFKKIENWYYWLFTNIISVGVYAYKGIYLTSLLYIILIMVVINGIVQWRKALPKTNRYSASTITTQE